MVQTINSPAAQVIIAVIPIVGIVIAGAVAILSILWHHSEVKLRIKTGTYEKPVFNYKAYVLLIGLLLSLIGVALTLFFLAIKGVSNALLGGLIPLTVGISFLLFYKFNDWGKSKPSDEN
ncbi:MAG: hypothetical protein KBT11_10905 [Treponema sp.]|nr:hypothetical protein [Candidatus Treponema equifaecale]